MIDPCSTNTEGMEIPIEEMWEEKRELNQLSSMDSSNTFSGLHPLTTKPEICLAYHPLSHIILQKHAIGEKWGSELYSSVEHASNNLHSLLNLVDGTSRNETSSTYPTSDLRKLEQRYIFRNQSEVMDFAVNNSFLLQPLHEACEQIREYFGNSAQAILEVITDPEFVEDQELVIFIRTNLSPDEAFKKLEQIDDEWWLDIPANIRKKLCIDVEFE